MTVKWFGEDWGAPICSESDHASTPVGERCIWCDEFISGDDNGLLVWCAVEPPEPENRQNYDEDQEDYASGYRPIHYECHMRQVMGSVEHQRKLAAGRECDATCCDDPALSRRMAALAACMEAGCL